MAGPLQHPLRKASCNIHLKQMREKEGKPQLTKKGSNSQIPGKGREEGIL